MDVRTFLWTNKLPVNLIVPNHVSKSVVTRIGPINLLVLLSMLLRYKRVNLCLSSKRRLVWFLLLPKKLLAIVKQTLISFFVSLIVPVFLLHDPMENDGKRWKICFVSSFVKCLSRNKLSVQEKLYIVFKVSFRKYLTYWND